jgi:transcriptional regulator with XRE-family HTH domain
MSIRNLKGEFGFKYDSRDIGEHIAELREAKKWTRNKLARISCIDAPVLTHIEKGESSPVLDTLLMILDGLGLRPAEFFQPFN